MNLYALMDKLGIRPDPFIGEEIVLPATAAPAWLRRADLDDLLARPAASPYVPVDKPSGYLRLVRSVFADQTEEAGRTRTLAEQELEFVLPRELSCNTVIGLPVLHAEEVLIGLETRHLPVPQIHEGDARILTAPAWRLDRQVETLDQAKSVLAAISACRPAPSHRSAPPIFRAPASRRKGCTRSSSACPSRRQAGLTIMSL